MNKVTEIIPTASVQRAYANLPHGFTDRSNDRDFMYLVAILRSLYGFSIARPFEIQGYIDKEKDDLSYYSLCPSIIFDYADFGILMQEYHTTKERATKPDDEVLFAITNKIKHESLKEQWRMMQLLEEFYATRQPISFYARLIVENHEVGSGYLKPFGASAQAILDSDHQKEVAHDGRSEMVAFGVFLMNKYEDSHSTAS